MKGRRLGPAPSNLKFHEGRDAQRELIQGRVGFQVQVGASNAEISCSELVSKKVDTYLTTLRE
jgi:hypothetical protein